MSWVAHALRSTLAFAINLAIVTGLFLMSAHLASQPGQDEQTGALVVRTLASVWFYIAAWTWVVRGLFRRPAKPADKRKPTGTEVLKGTFGCLANLVPIPFVFVLVGRFADWAYAGITGPDDRHPARVAVDRLIAGAPFVLEHAVPWVPLTLAAVVVVKVIGAVFRASRASRARTGLEGRQVRDVNKATLEKLRARKPATSGDSRKRQREREREILAPAGAASAASVGAAHHGAHAPDMSRFQAPAGVREDRVLGALTFSASENAWWAHREDGGFPVQIEGKADGPDTHAVDLARQAVQRGFEVLLRASEAARPIAQKRGVGLPRFTIAAIKVAEGAAPDVTVHLRCDADPGHEYTVQSTDKLNTFTLA